MNEFWNSVVSGVVGGVASAAVWAVLLWAGNFTRNRLVERKLRKAFARIGSAYGDEGFGVTLKNETEVLVIVRDVTLLTPMQDRGIGLQFTEPTAEFLIQEKKTRKPMKFHIQTRGRRIQPALTAHGFVELPPYTGGTWRLDPGFYLENPDLRPISCRATIEYKTLLGSPKLIIIQSNKGNAKLLQDQYPKFLEYIRKKIKIEQDVSEAGKLAAPER